MTPLLAAMLASHVLLGIAGVACSYATWMELLKKTCALSYLKKLSMGATILYFLTWLSGGYYYVLYYGTTVKPIILAGNYPWAHKFFLEVKEHIFMFLPFLALAMTFALWTLKDEDVPRKRALALLAGATTIIGILVTLAAVVVSGAVR